VYLDEVMAGIAIDDEAGIVRPSAAADLRPKCRGILSSMFKRKANLLDRWMSEANPFAWSTTPRFLEHHRQPRGQKNKCTEAYQYSGVKIGHGVLSAII
jgi:hypothetical protein